MIAVLGSGIVEGFVLALVAVGFTIIYNSTKVVNFANGQMMIAGAYVSWFASTRLGWGLGLAILAGVVAGAVLGVITDRVFIAPLRRAPLLTQVIALLGLASILDGGFVQVFGNDTRSLPPYAPTIGFVPGLNWSWMDIIIMVATTLVAGALIAFLYLTERGTHIRAAADNPLGASLVGINPNAIALAAWAAGGAITALGGALIIPKLLLDPAIGSRLTFLAFAAVVVGGFGSLFGAIVGGLIIGVVQAGVAGLLSAGFEPLVGLVIMLVLLSFRPSGLFGART
jgi:branched-chain amino acid transport system permease protein